METSHLIRCEVSKIMSWTAAITEHFRRNGRPPNSMPGPRTLESRSWVEQAAAVLRTASHSGEIRDKVLPPGVEPRQPPFGEAAVIPLPEAWNYVGEAGFEPALPRNTALQTAGLPDCPTRPWGDQPGSNRYLQGHNLACRPPHHDRRTR